MKKIILIMFCLFIFTGCEVTYDLNLDSNKEIVISKDDSNSDNKKLYDVYSKKPIPLSRYSSILSESNKKLKNTVYYNTEDISDGNIMGLKFTGEFKKVNISESNMLVFGGRNVEIIEKDNKISVYELNRIKLFDQFPSLDKLTINIKCSKKVKIENSDKKSWNKYTWIFTRDNYENKTVKIEFEEGNKLININKPTTKFNLLLFMILIIGGVVFLVFHFKNKKINSI